MKFLKVALATGFSVVAVACGGELFGESPRTFEEDPADLVRDGSIDGAHSVAPGDAGSSVDAARDASADVDAPIGDATADATVQDATVAPADATVADAAVDANVLDAGSVDGAADAQADASDGGLGYNGHYVIAVCSTGVEFGGGARSTAETVVYFADGSCDCSANYSWGCYSTFRCRRPPPPNGPGGGPPLPYPAESAFLQTVPDPETWSTAPSRWQKRVEVMGRRVYEAKPVEPIDYKNPLPPRAVWRDRAAGPLVEKYWNCGDYQTSLDDPAP